MRAYKTVNFSVMVITLIGLLMLAFPLAAQDTPCAPDLAPVRELLDQAEAQIAGGDNDAAVANLNSAREQLQTLIAACTPVNLSQSLVTHGGQLALNYPEGWDYEVVNESDDPGDPTNVQFANDSAVFERAGGSIPELIAGDQLVFMIAGEPDAIVDELDAAPSPQAILKAIQQTIKESNEEEEIQFDEIEQSSIHDRRAATLNMRYSSFEARVFALELEREDFFVVLLAVSAPGELDTIVSIAEDMAASLQYDSDGIPQ